MEKIYDLKTFIVKNDERKGTCYHEFYLGKWELHKDKHWNDNSIFIHDNDFDCFMYILLKNFEKYDRYSFRVFNKQEGNKIIDLFSIFANLLFTDKNIRECFGALNVEGIEEMFYDQIEKVDRIILLNTTKKLIQWIAAVLEEYGCFTILGI